MTEAEARAFVRQQHKGVLATIKRDGRPQLSNIVYAQFDDGVMRISVTRDRAKTKNLRRDPRASIAIQGDNWYQHVVAEGTVEIFEGDTLASDLREYYRAVRGEHPNWQEYDEAMVREQRILLLFHIEHLYPISG
ncbi:MAG: PPOX class F420-dependent oxidoreductase [Chloroflexi bacterium]|nr:PPOX class F420-dependent oxidoreductase [Chloroflexota bacterium]